ncbi:MAG TPA: ATP-dependent Clp protease ATP-binding subunit [Patescibacteria group bacterium]|nr:ATP-dependent Clp protease ATP-binding subunit [Patescibacteria group bacterium]
MNEFNRFSAEAKKIIKVAENIATDMNTQTGSNHILLSIASSSNTASAEVLRNNGINIDRIHLAISISRLSSFDVFPIGVSNETKKLVEKALVWAKDLGSSMVEPDHLFLAILSEPGFAGYKILEDLGIDSQLLKEQLLSMLTGSEKAAESASNSEETDEEPVSGFGEFGKLGEIFDEPFFGQALQAIRPKKSSSSVLANYTLDLTQKASEGVLDPIVGRGPEIQRVLRILNRRNKNNPVLVGEPGVGKTAIVEGLAQKIIAGDIPKNIAGKRILVLDLALLLAGTKYRGEFEERIKKVTKEIMQAKDIILFIDELHTIVGAGSAEGAMDAANILKPALARGDLRLVGATTLDDYRKYIEKDPALERRLQMVKVDEPTPEETLQILQGIKKKYEEFHHVNISDEAIEAAVELSVRYISDRFLPDKAVDLIDEAASDASLYASPRNPELINLKKQYNELEKEKDQLVARENFKKAAQIKIKQRQIRQKILQSGSKTSDIHPIIINRTNIAKVVSEWTKIPVSSLVKEEIAKFKNLEQILKKRIKGQDEAIDTISQSIKRSRTGVTAETRPLGSFIFLGPTGVGKTELAKVLAEEIFESSEALIKIDMSEFMEKHNISRLVGAPPGYVGYEEAGKLTESIRRRPYSVVLFDEIEKAHPDVQNILLQVLEDGYLTDARGRRVNFRNTIIIMTSNIGMRELTTQAVVGFRAQDNRKQDFLKSYEQMKDKVLRDLKQQFRPEFLNRVDRVVVFKPLGEKEIAEIVDLRLSELIERLQKGQEILLKFSPKVREKIAKIGFDPENGARPIRRAISDLVEEPLAEAILAGEIKSGQKVLVDLRGDKIVFK